MIFPGALGDLLLVLPTLRRLRRRSGRARVTLVVAEPLRALVRSTGVAEHVASLDDASSAWLFGGSATPAWLADRPAVYAWLGADDAGLRRRLAAVADPVRLLSVERGPGRMHAAVAYARAAGVVGARRRLEADARLEPGDAEEARALTARLGRPILAIHRGAGARAKRWAPGAFAAVVSSWRSAGGSVVELLGPAEADDEPLPGSVPVPDWSLPGVAALLRLVDAYVGNDSGLSHLAGAVGARGAVVFTATDPVRWRPLSPSLVAVRGLPTDRDPAPPPARVLQALARVESLTSSHPGSSVRA
jgi:heptosyltransferase III